VIRLRTLAIVVLCCGALVWSSTSLAQTADRPPLPRLAIEIADVETARSVESAALSFPLAFRVHASESDSAAEIDRRLSPFDPGRSVWLVVPAPSTIDGVAAFRELVGAVVERHRAVVVLEIELDRQPIDVARFAVQAVAVDVRAGRGRVRVGIGGTALADPDRAAAIYNAELAPYVDLVLLPERSEVLARARGVDPQVALAVASSADGRDPVTQLLNDLGSEIAARVWQAADLPAPVLRRFQPLAPLLTHAVSALDDAGADIRIMSADGDRTGAVPHRLLLDNETLARYFWYVAPVAATPLELELTLSIEGSPMAINLLSGQRLPTPGYEHDRTTSRVRVSLPQERAAPVLLAFDEEGVSINDRSAVTAERALLVGEIIARHQQQQRTQDGVLRNYIAHARMEQHFRPSVADPGYDVVTENTYYVAEDGIEWDEQSFSVNGSKWGADRPPFPLLQPEKVLALPLQLRFDEGYRYRLVGIERIGEVECYAVRFEPVRDDRSLYRGTVWIDRRTFARVRVQAVQNGLTAPVVSNEEIQTFSTIVDSGAPPVVLFSELSARQILLVAGRNLLVEKRVIFSDFEINREDFELRRATARRSDRVMYRETEQGLRHFVKDGDQRVVSEQQALGVRALAMGVTLDPSYAFPLPILGINYIDFQFRRPDTQLAILFAGVLAAGNVQRSRLIGPIDASVDFFGIAVPSTDRLFGATGDDPTTRLLTWPLTTGLNLGWQATPYQRATLQYQFRFDGYVRDRTTRETFDPPSSTTTNGIGGAWEYRRAGYSLVTNGALYRRSGWQPWGDGEETPPSYVKYSVNLSRDFYFGPFQKLHFNGAWFSGRDLDRFGKYQFGMFDDTRIHGVPNGGVRYGELAMARGSYSVNIFEQYRVDLFLEHAWGRDDAGRGNWERLPGFGVALNLRAPWNTILRADFGQSVLPARYRGLGSTTLQIMLLKPLR
jgi:hypothetical protein